MCFRGHEVGVVVLLRDLFHIFSGINDHKRDMVGTKLFGDLYGEFIVVTDNEVLFQPGDLIKHFTLLDSFLEISLFDHFGNNTHRDGKNDETEYDKGNGEDTPRIRDGPDLTEPNRRKRDPCLIDGIHKRKVIDDHIAHCAQQHNKNSKDQRKSKRGEVRIELIIQCDVWFGSASPTEKLFKLFYRSHDKRVYPPLS